MFLSRAGERFFVTAANERKRKTEKDVKRPTKAWRFEVKHWVERKLYCETLKHRKSETS
jgi:hypothetical protein